jgi:hypothetical protein
MGVRLKRTLFRFRKRMGMNNNYTIHEVCMVKQSYATVITDKEY